MTFTNELIAPTVAICSISCGLFTYFLHKGKELSKLGWFFMIINIVIFIFLNNFLLEKLIQHIAYTDNGFINIYDEDFLFSLKENIIWIMVFYILSSSYGGYLGAKRRFKINSPEN
ncbi:hypothetical protein M0I95_005247 [Klebsiella pneumoniae]|nr:hypothetical protein [Klebsiella pneumoniae]